MRVSAKATAAIHRLDERLTEMMLGFAEERFPEVMERHSRSAPYQAVAEGDVLYAILPWSLYLAPVEGSTLAQLYLAEHASKLSSRKRQWIGALTGTTFSVWHVDATRPGSSLEMTDLLTGARRVVLDRLASQNIPPKSVLVARIVDFDGISLLVGMYPRSIPPRAKDELLARMRKKLRLRGGENVSIERLKPHAKALLELAHELTGQMAEPPPVETSEPDELVLLIDVFRFERRRRAALLDRLRASGAEIHTERQDLTVFTLRGAREGGAGSVLGYVVVKASRLETEADANEDADVLRELVEEMVGDLVTFLRRRIEKP